MKYLDPVYLKQEKLDVIVSLACEENIVQILNELREYATEIDIEFVRHSIRAIGQCAISFEKKTAQMRRQTTGACKYASELYRAGSRYSHERCI